MALDVMGRSQMLHAEAEIKTASSQMLFKCCSKYAGSIHHVSK